jgi:hypothetical protein
MKKQYVDFAIVIIFLCFIFIFSGWSLVKSDETISELENRKLAMKPDITLSSLVSGNIFTEYTKYYNDQFPVREFWVESNAALEKHLLKQHVVRGVYIHDDGYLISPVKYDNARNRLHNISKKIDQFTNDLKKSGIPVYFALVPNKTVIMENKLPSYVESHANEYSNILLNSFKETKTIDLRETIKSNFNKDSYFFTDHHWTIHAAFDAYQRILQFIADDHPDVGNPLVKSQFKWITSEQPFYGSEARKITKSYVKKPDYVTIAEYKGVEEKIKICYRAKCDREFNDLDFLNNEMTYTNRYGVYLSGDQPEIVITNPNKEKGLNLLIFKDSYANPTIQFFARNFHVTRVIDLRHFSTMKIDYAKQSINNYIQNRDIDIILFIHNINSIFTPDFVNFQNI